MDNYAGRVDKDKEIAEELEIAKIKIANLNFFGMMEK